MSQYAYYSRLNPPRDLPPLDRNYRPASLERYARHRRRSRTSPAYRPATLPGPSRARSNGDAADAQAEVDLMHASFLSEPGALVSGSAPLGESEERGRPAARRDLLHQAATGTAVVSPASRGSTLPPPSSRRGTSASPMATRPNPVVFLAVWALVGLSGLGAAGLRRGPSLQGSFDMEPPARAWSFVPPPSPAAFFVPSPPLPPLPPSSPDYSLHSSHSFGRRSLDDDQLLPILDGYNKPSEQPLPPVDLERLVGRVAAWTCATLYLTSRLPQIWKNVCYTLKTHFLIFSAEWSLEIPSFAGGQLKVFRCFSSFRPFWAMSFTLSALSSILGCKLLKVRLDMLRSCSKLPFN
jgi:hypothetical protein